MRKFKNVEYTNPFELLFLFGSTLGVFLGILFLLNRIIDFSLFVAILAIITAVIYFIFLKKKFIVKTSDFELTSDKLKWNNKKIDFKDLQYYKIHWLTGAGIKFKLKNGKVIRVSSNDNFCNSENFVNLCIKIDSKLLNYNNGKIVRKKSFFETRQGYYFAAIMTILIVIITVYKLLTDKKVNIQNFSLILISLGTICSGIRWKIK